MILAPLSIVDQLCEKTLFRQALLIPPQNQLLSFLCINRALNVFRTAVCPFKIVITEIPLQLSMVMSRSSG